MDDFVFGLKIITALGCGLIAGAFLLSRTLASLAASAAFIIASRY